MADNSDRERRLLSTYMVLRKMLLEKIPAGIEIPDPGTKLEKIDTESSVKYARRIIRDMPADPWILGLVEQLTLDWLDALYMCRTARRIKDPIFGDLADAAFTRFAATVNAINAGKGKS
ncbi:hypothetical protein ACIP5Y_21730 [Nocardia sp. NPDC088792]|uniref:hypothetical protein n=1 Tax=Nocardia sp. NPDC088792 TaxID=3364332 RepID=UPI00380D8598